MAQVLAAIVAFKEIISLLIPLVLRALSAMRDKEVRDLVAEVKAAKTVEEKRDAARKFADALYRN